MEEIRNKVFIAFFMYWWFIYVNSTSYEHSRLIYKGVNLGHFILGAGLRANPNSHIVGHRIVQFYQIQPKGIYTRGLPEHSLIPCGVIGGINLAPNHRAALKKLG